MGVGGGRSVQDDTLLASMVLVSETPTVTLDVDISGYCRFMDLLVSEVVSLSIVCLGSSKSRIKYLVIFG